MQSNRRFEHVSDDELLHRLSSLLGDSRRTEADLVAHIGEVDERRLYAREAFPSIFAYCMEALHLSEAEAVLRIGAARTAREHPVILEMLSDGRLHLSGISKLAPHLSREDGPELLARAAYRSKRQILELVAEIAPRPDAPAVMRKLPERKNVPMALQLQPTPNTPTMSVTPAVPIAPDTLPRPDEVTSSVASPSTIEPLAPARYKVQFTASAELRDKLESLKKLMHGDLAEVIERAVTETLQRMRKRRYGLTKARQSVPTLDVVTESTRYIPAALRRAVYVRDEGRCRYTDDGGRRCSERDGLEYHHRNPHGLGGECSLRNVCLMCHPHNQYLADLVYGRTKMAEHRKERPSA
jgi:hypothetical protein